jgi:hypothetical protein
MNTTKPLRNPDITLQDIGNEVVLYSATADAVHVLNPTAKLIWELCDGQHTLANIEQVLRANFAIPPDQDVMADIRQTLETFAAKGLLHGRF